MKSYQRTDHYFNICLPPIADPGPWQESLFITQIQKILLEYLNFLLDVYQALLHNIGKLMNHLTKLFIDIVIEVVEAYDRISRIFEKKPKPSFIACNVFWCTNSEWMDRLVAYKQLELWTDR